MNIINLSVPAGVSSPVAECGAVMIGYVGEGGVTKVTLNFSSWAEAYGDGVITLGVQRSGDPTWYPVALTVEGTTAAWLVSKLDTTVEGMGVARFAYTVGGAEKRSAVWNLFVDRGLQSPEGDVPDPYESWVETLTGLGAETLQNAQDAQDAADAAEQSATDAEGSAESAETAKNAAGAAAAAAGESARAAGENASRAQGAAQAAQNAAGAAEQSATDAEAAQQAAETAVTHYPKIVNDYWWVWDAERGEYVNTGVKAKGEGGEGAVLSVNGQTGEVTLDAEDVGALPDSSTLDDIPDGATYKRPTAAQVQQIQTNAADIQTQGGEIDQLQTDVDAIEGKIPAQASASNQLADKAFVNSSVQTNTAHFRGNWATWADVPSSAADYPADDDGNTTPTTNDYMVVQDASGYPVAAGEDALTGTWRFKYTGIWAGHGKSGWKQEYQVNETPLTAAQLAALNSGATAAIISSVTDKLDKTGDGSDVTTAFSIAANRANISTGEKLSVIFGKIAKWFSDLGSAAFRAATGSITQGSTDLVESGAVYNGLSGKYSKPAGGIPASDMAPAVQTSLGLADTALQAVPNTYRTAAAQDVIDAGKLDAPATAGTTGQIIEKGATGTVWADRDKVVTVTGTTPTITAMAGVRYVCGEVSTLDIMLPASGVVDVTFESGSTATVLTITPPSGVTVRWANGFDPTTLEADTTYELSIMDGLGVAIKWS